MPKFWRWLQWLFLFSMLMCSCALAEELSVLVPVRGGTVEIQATVIDGEYWFFLPSDTDITRLAVRQPDGSAFPYIHSLSEEDGIFTAHNEEKTLHFMRSENIRSVFLFSDDPENQGRAYIDNSDGHSVYTSGSLLLLGENGAVDHAEKIKKLRGRGNGTWHWEKKPYQLKLRDKVDLLDSGDTNERERTWILLAMATDGTYLHDRLTFDLAHELGDQTASNSEHVNLYYDGEYRGLYLLCEKTEIGSGRIDELDYDNIIEMLFKYSGRSDLASLSSAQDQNRFNNSFSYTENLEETSFPGAGAFLLELETEGRTLSDPCWFLLSNGTLFASKNPEQASRTMMLYISERLEEALQTLQNRGVHPSNGRTVSDDFDIEAFARSILLSEFSGNLDSYLYSSTYFVLPAEEKRFLPGPPWDYDLAYRYPVRGDAMLDATGLRDRKGWIPSFLACAEMRAAIETICKNKLFSTIYDILLGTTQGVYLHSIDDYVSQIDAARRMNEIIWETVQDERLVYGNSFEEEIDLLKQYLFERGEWLAELISEWDSSPEQFSLWADAAYTNVEGDLAIGVYPWSNIQIESYEWKEIAEATEDNYAVWQVDLFLSAKDDRLFTNPVVTINGTSVTAIPSDDGTLSVSFTFEDPSYRPFDAYGEDIGMVYNYDIYTRRYPEVAKMCDYDQELVLDYFLDEGMYEGHKANAYFSPSEILYTNQYIEDFLGTDWWLYYQEYLAYGYSEWLLPENARFEIQVLNNEPPA